jgi:hypothetical protein
VGYGDQAVPRREAVCASDLHVKTDIHRSDYTVRVAGRARGLFRENTSIMAPSFHPNAPLQTTRARAA